MENTEQKMVWTVSTGEYSSYKIIGIFSTEEKALEFLEAVAPGDFYWDTPYLDKTYIVDEGCAVSDYVRNGYFRYRVRMDYEGNVIGEPRKNEWPYSWDGEGEDLGTDIVRFRMWAKSSEQAIKIANERRIQLIANNMWENKHE